MKKIFAILLIALFMFNLFGYRLLFTYQQQQSDLQLKASLDKQQYDEADLITIKVPLSLPYVNNQQSFERVDGEITVNGKILKYVKRKIADGQLILLCLPDHNKMRIESAKDEFFKFANDLVQNNHSRKPVHSKSGAFKNLPFVNSVAGHAHTTTYCCSLYTYNMLPLLNFLPSSHQFLPEQPPDVV